AAAPRPGDRRGSAGGRWTRPVLVAAAAARRCLTAGLRHRLAAPVTGLALTLALVLPLGAAVARSSWMQRPTGLLVSGASYQSVSLSWTTVAGAAGYDVYANKTRAGSTTGTAYTDTGLA